MKTCPKCKSEKKRAEFYKNAQKRDGLQSLCKACASEASKKHYRKSPKTRAAVRQSALNLKRENYRRSLEYLEAHPCVDCGEDDPIVLDFDHVRGKKKGNVSKMIRDASWKRVAAEILKCEIRCANCHRKKTARTLGWYKKLEFGS